MQTLMGQEGVLELPTRKEIFDTVKAQPGICIRELERTLGLAIGELTYHLPILLKAGLINEDNDGYFRRFFPNGLSKKEMSVIALMRRDAAKRVIPLLLSMGKVDSRQLSEELSLSISTAKWHLERMEKNDIVIKRKVGKTNYFELKDTDVVRKIYLL